MGREMLSSDISKILGANQREFSVLRGNLLSASQGSLPKAIMVASSRSGEGRSTTAIAVAHAFVTESNARVLLVDADTESPSLHGCFGAVQAPGLSDCLDGGGQDAIVKSGIDRLDVLPAGDSPEATARLLSGDGLGGLIKEWSQQYDHIVLDSSPALSTSAPVSLASQVDGVLLVVACERTKWQVLETAQQRLVGSGGKVLGVILNRRKHYIPRFLYGSV